MADLDRLFELFNWLGAVYRADHFDLALFPPIARECYEILRSTALSSHYANIKREGEEKSYWVFIDNLDATNISRPYRPALLINSYDEWQESWDKMVGSINQRDRRMGPANIDRVLYSAAMAFFAVIDLSQRGSRKRNGTFLEWLLGSLLVAVSGFQLTRQIPIPDSGEGSVPTDIVLDPGAGRYKLVFPVKTSTRERIGQTFTHQRILDAEFPGKYRSALLCVSETQLLKGANAVQETCVPQQVSFNEKYIAHIDALYYLDPPFAYINDSITVPVRRLGDLFSTDLAAMSRALEEAATDECGHMISTVDCSLPRGHNGDHLFLPPRGSPIESETITAEDVGD